MGMKQWVLSATFAILLSGASCADAANESAWDGWTNHGELLLAAAARREDRREDRQDKRGDRQDCRQEEGAVGHDKRDCRQDARRSDEGNDKDDE